MSYAFVWSRSLSSSNCFRTSRSMRMLNWTSCACAEGLLFRAGLMPTQLTPDRRTPAHGGAENYDCYVGLTAARPLAGMSSQPPARSRTRRTGFGFVVDPYDDNPATARVRIRLRHVVPTAASQTRKDARSRTKKGRPAPPLDNTSARTLK